MSTTTSAHTWTATAILREAPTFEATAGSGHRVILDTDEIPGGGNRGFRPLELLLIGDAGCAGMVVASFLRRMGQEVADYRINVAADRAETHPKVFTRITVEHELRGKGLSAAKVREAIATATGKYCPVVIMLARSVPTTHRYRVVDLETEVEESGIVEQAG